MEAGGVGSLKNNRQSREKVEMAKPVQETVEGKKELLDVTRSPPMRSLYCSSDMPMLSFLSLTKYMALGKALK